VPAARWLVSLSAPAPDPAGPAAGRVVHSSLPGGDLSRVARLPALRVDVPALSQMVEDPAIASRICSPTSVAMVLGALGLPATAAAVAEDVFHPGLDRYGIWPAAIAAAGRRGALGYVLRFPDWSAAAWCLEHGLPVIASVRYEPGGLPGAPMESTSGHLLVITGQDGSEVLVNDPAAPTAATVSRRYSLEALARAWLGGSGIGYILFRP
jgi:hypothetical protein